MRNPLHIGLFEGIGGFGLAAKWNGIETIATCDINEFGNTVTAYSFPTWRRESITAMGNAVVPQIPQMIINLIKKIENNER